MPLTTLACPNNSEALVLSPLEGMPLKLVILNSTRIADVSPLMSCTALESLDVRNTQTTATAFAALIKALPNCKIEWGDPAQATPQPAASGTK
jgi:hypothetical protein